MKHFFLLVILSITISALKAQSYPTSKGNNTSYEYISNVQIGTINNTTTGSDADGDGEKGYDDFTTQTAVLIPGSTYNLSVTIHADSKDYIKAWIDWNDDGDFTDAGESYVLATNTSSNGPHSVSITVPASASDTHTRMRVSLKWYAAPASDETFQYGEVEDYSIYVDKDSDGDGIYDIDDLDDDNDGILDDDENLCLSQDFYNGNFENNAIYPTTYIITDASNIYGWETTASDNKIEIWKSGFNGVPAYKGTYFAEINANKNNSNTIVGTGSSTGKHLPMEMWYGYTYSQSIFLSTDFPTDFQNNGGVINKISYYYNGNSSNTDDIKIYMANTSKSSFSSNNDWVAFADLTKVYDGSITTTTTAGWIELTLSTPFHSNGSNVVVAFDENTNGYHSNSDEFHCTSVSGRRSIYYYNDYTNPDPSSPPNATGRNNYIPNMKFSITPAQRLYQTLNVDPGDIVKWKVAHRGRAGVDTMAIKVGPTGSPTTQQIAATGTSAWKVYSSSYTVPAGVTQIEVGFEAIYTASGNSSIGNFIDDVQLYVTKTTYCDYDGDGVPNKLDLDSDNDGILDSEEWTEDTDGDGILDYFDLDSDNDGIPDAIEANNGVAPSGYSSSTGRISGTDSDGDGLLNSVDSAPSTAYGSSVSTLDRKDHDGDGVKDFVDLDSDNDGILDIVEAGGSDSNGDGFIDGFYDSNNDGYHNAYTSSPLPIPNTDSGTEAVALPNYIDQDSDGDGIDDLQEGLATCGIDTPCFSVPSSPADADGDGILNDYDISQGGTPVTPYDKESDGIPDYIDSDSDDDSYSDRVEGDDTNNDQVADSSPSGTDANENGIDDAFDNYCSGTTSLTINRDDYGEEYVSTNPGHMFLTSSDLELCYAVDDGGLQKVGIHYNAVNIPAGATITNAYIQFQVDEATSGTVTLTIRGEDADNASIFSSTNYDISNRTLTTASVSWSPANWPTVGAEGADQRTSDIKTIIQEIVDRSGWSSGNNLVLIITGSSTSAYRTAENNPTLHISYSGGMSYACGTTVPVQDNDGDGEADFRDDTDDSGGLPIKLLDLGVEMDDSVAIVKWTTVTEVNNSYFIVERSKNGVDFQSIGIVDGAGASNQILNYHFIDIHPLTGISYYRLKQVDFNGEYTYSKIVTLQNNNSDNAFIVYPNPSNGILNISTNLSGNIMITSVDGRLLYNHSITANAKSQINLGNPPKGLYIITLFYENSTIVKRLIIK